MRADAAGPVVERADDPVGPGADARRYEPVGGRAVAELPEVVAAPAPELAGATPAGVFTARRDRRPVGARPDARRRQPGGGRAVAELPGRVETPTPELTAGPDPAGVGSSGRGGEPVGAGPDARRDHPARGRAVADRSGRVLTPTPELAAGSDPARVVSANRHGEPVGVRPDARRHQPVGGRAVADLAAVVVAPTPQLARPKPASVVAAAAHRGPSGQREADEQGAGQRVGVPGPELTSRVVSPTKQVALGLGDPTRVIDAGAHRRPAQREPRGDGNRHPTVRRGPDADLTFVVGAPTPSLGAVADAATEVVSTLDRGPWVRRLHVRRRRPTGRRSVTELPVAVRTPGEVATSAHEHRQRGDDERDSSELACWTHREPPRQMSIGR